MGKFVDQPHAAAAGREANIRRGAVQRRTNIPIIIARSASVQRFSAALATASD
jgi:hypothetical protein